MSMLGFDRVDSMQSWQRLAMHDALEFDPTLKGMHVPYVQIERMGAG